MQEITLKNSRKWSRLGQKGTVCGVALPEILEQQKNSYVITADLGRSSGLNRIMEHYSDQFINVGIAEQNMIGVAAGIALEGNIVFATTFATFLTMRGYEQIRHNLGYQKANVKLIGTSAGFSIGMFGNTHYSYEDVALMRVIPDMTVISPADAAEAYMAIHKVTECEGPAYIRLSGGLEESAVYKQAYDFQLGKAVVMKEGKDIVLIATGAMVIESIKAAEKLETIGIYATVINMHTIKPLDIKILKEFSQKDIIFTVEEHSVIGGLGSAVAEYFATLLNPPAQVFIGIDDRFVNPGKHEYVKRRNQLDAQGIYQRVLSVLDKEE